MEYWFAKYCKESYLEITNKFYSSISNIITNTTYPLFFLTQFMFTVTDISWKSAGNGALPFDNAYCLHPVNTVLKLTECIPKQTCDKVV